MAAAALDRTSVRSRGLRRRSSSGTGRSADRSERMKRVARVKAAQDAGTYNKKPPAYATSSLSPGAQVVADINVVTQRSMVQGLTSPWDTNAVKVKTQILAGGSIRDTFLGTWRAASPDDFSIATEPNAPRMYWVSNLDFFASTAYERNVDTLSSRLSPF